MTEAQLIALIVAYVKANGNNEITGDGLQAILQSIVEQSNDKIGELNDLTSSDKTSVVAAINELVTLIGNYGFQNPAVESLNMNNYSLNNVDDLDVYGQANFFEGISVNNERIENVADGVNDTDAVNVGQLNDAVSNVGSGSGDMLAANNLSDLTDVSVARDNLDLDTYYARLSAINNFIPRQNFTGGIFLGFNGTQGIVHQSLNQIGVGIINWSVSDTSVGYTGATQEWVNTKIRPYKVYSALLNAGTGATPTAIVLENTTNGTIAFTRNSAGNYTATITGDTFTEDKTLVLFQKGGNIGIVGASRTSDSEITIFQFANGGGAIDGFTDASFEIRIYN